LGGVGAAVGEWFFAHRHGQLRGLVDAVNTGLGNEQNPGNLQTMSDWKNPVLTRVDARAYKATRRITNRNAGKDTIMISIMESIPDASTVNC